LLSDISRQLSAVSRQLVPMPHALPLTIILYHARPWRNYTMV